MVKIKKWAGIVLKHGDEVLMCKRSPKKSMPNTWSIPSGHIEDGESPGAAALREFFEETNLEIDTNIEFIGFVDKFKSDGTKKGHMFIFLKNSDTKLIPDLKRAKDGFEHSECKYFDDKNLPNQKGNEELIEIIKKVLK